MKQVTEQTVYTSPELEVIEVNALQVMCTSSNDMPVDDVFNF